MCSSSTTKAYGCFSPAISKTCGLLVEKERELLPAVQARHLCHNTLTRHTVATQATACRLAFIHQTTLIELPGQRWMRDLHAVNCRIKTCTNGKPVPFGRKWGCQKKTHLNCIHVTALACTKVWGGNKITARTIKYEVTLFGDKRRFYKQRLTVGVNHVVSDSLTVRVGRYMPIINKPSAHKLTNTTFIVSVLDLPFSLTKEDGCLQVFYWQKLVIGRINEVTNGKGCGSDYLSCNKIKTT